MNTFMEFWDEFKSSFFGLLGILLGMIAAVTVIVVGIAWIANATHDEVLVQQRIADCLERPNAKAVLDKYGKLEQCIIHK